MLKVVSSEVNVRKEAKKRQSRFNQALSARETIQSRDLKKLDDLLVKHVGAQRFADAVEVLEHLISLSPSHFPYHNLSGELYLKLRDPERAIHAFSKALELQPSRADVYIGLGTALFEYRQFEGAAASFELAVMFDANNHLTVGRQALALVEIAQFEKALALFDRALAMAPCHAPHYLNRGKLLGLIGRHDEALADFQAAVTISPQDNAFQLAGAVHWSRLGKHEAAIEIIEALIHAGNVDPATFNFLGITQMELGHHDSAEKSYRKALELDPSHADSNFNLALLLLLLGRHEEGWCLYEKREIRNSRKPGFPLFDGRRMTPGKDFSSEVLLVHCEQGVGDTIMFSRYILSVSQMVSKIYFVVQDVVFPLFKNLPANVECVKLSDPLPQCTLYVPLLSLPYICGTTKDTIPAQMLSLSRARVDIFDGHTDWLPPVSPKVGVVWSGNAQHSNDRNRSIGLADFMLAISDLEKAVVLQKDIKPIDQEILGANDRLVTLSGVLTDMSVTAAVIEKLDLVITVDTSVAHLAATLGKPTWLLIPFNPDYRWFLGASDSPWYPSVRLFRQPVSGDWFPVLQQVRRELAAIRTLTGRCQPLLELADSSTAPVDHLSLKV